MGKQNTTVKLKPEQFEELKKYGRMGDHWSDVIDTVLKLAKQAQTSETSETSQTPSTEFNEAIVDMYGKASISRTLAGKKIEYRVKQ